MTSAKPILDSSGGFRTVCSKDARHPARMVFGVGRAAMSGCDAFALRQFMTRL